MMIAQQYPRNADLLRIGERPYLGVLCGRRYMHIDHPIIHLLQ
jgi:hypothetical protein